MLGRIFTLAALALFNAQAAAGQTPTGDDGEAGAALALIDGDLADLVSKAEHSSNTTSSWVHYGSLSAETADPVLAELFRRVAEDQYLREALVKGDGLRSANAAVRNSAAIRLHDADRDNTAWLKATITERGWFTTSRDGPEAASAAWLLTQHADQDPGFQREVLALMEPLAKTGEVQPADYALMFDRVAVNAGEPQRFGSQVVCSLGGPEPFPIEEPADEVDARRAAYGLPPLAEYLASFAEFCPGG